MKMTTNIKTRVMHLIHELGSGGAENGIINLANTIDKDIFDISVCSLAGEGARAKHLNEGIEHFTMQKNSGNDVSLPFRLYSLFRSWKPDIVHTHAWGTMLEGLIAAKMAGVPVLIHGEHGTIENKRMNRWFQKVLWRFFHNVLSISEQHKKQLCSTIGFPSKKITVLRNGVDTELFRPMSNIDVFGQKDKFVIGTVGRLVPVKNQALLIRAVSESVLLCPDIVLVIIGQGSLKKELMNLVENCGISELTTFAGSRFDIPEILNSVDLFVLPSLSEGMSNTILEAMSCQLPVIATNVGGNQELIEHNKTGILVESNNVEQMARSIYLLRADDYLRDRLGREARKKIESTFSIQSMTQEYQNLYIESLRKSNITIPDGAVKYNFCERRT